MQIRDFYSFHTISAPSVRVGHHSYGLGPKTVRVGNVMSTKSPYDIVIVLDLSLPQIFKYDSMWYVEYAGLLAFIENDKTLQKKEN